LAGEIVAEGGCAELGDGETAGGDDERLGAEAALGGLDEEAGGVVFDGDRVGIGDVLDFAALALGEEEVEDGVGGVVAEELA